LGGTAWVHYLHTKESFSDPNFPRWYMGWVAGANPGIEVLGRMRYAGDLFAGLFLKAGWFIPFTVTQWRPAADEPLRPEFSMSGLNLQLGVRFGATIQAAQDLAARPSPAALGGEGRDDALVQRNVLVLGGAGRPSVSRPNTRRTTSPG